MRWQRVVVCVAWKPVCDRECSPCSPCSSGRARSRSNGLLSSSARARIASADATRCSFGWKRGSRLAITRAPIAAYRGMVSSRGVSVKPCAVQCACVRAARDYRASRHIAQNNSRNSHGIFRANHSYANIEHNSRRRRGTFVPHQECTHRP